MQMIDKNDPYIGWRNPMPEPSLQRGTAALLVIDMQYGDAHMEHGIMARRREMGQLAGLDYFAERLRLIIPNIQRLQDAFRQRGMEVIFARIQAITRDGREKDRAYRQSLVFTAPGSKEAEILEEVAPVGDEMVFSKTTGSVFNGTNIHYALTNMGIKNLVMVGVMTSGCVESAARDAKDLGYGVIVVDDACGTWTEEMHQASLRVMGEVFAKIKTTDQVLAALPS